MKKTLIYTIILVFMAATIITADPPDDTNYVMIDGYWNLNDNGAGTLMCWTNIGQFGHGPANGDDTWISDPGGDKTWGDEFDRKWVQLVNPNYGVWDLTTEYAEVVVALNQDHGPYPAEALEYKIWGCNNFDHTKCDCVDPWILADLDRVYKHGWSTVGETGNIIYCDGVTSFCNDDFTAVWDFNGSSYRYIKLQSVWGGSYNEPEVDVVKGVKPTIPAPEFGSLMAALAILLSSPAFAYLIVKKTRK